MFASSADYAFVLCCYASIYPAHLPHQTLSSSAYTIDGRVWRLLADKTWQEYLCLAQSALTKHHPVWQTISDPPGLFTPPPRECKPKSGQLPKFIWCEEESERGKGGNDGHCHTHTCTRNYTPLETAANQPTYTCWKTCANGPNTKHILSVTDTHTYMHTHILHTHIEIHTHTHLQPCSPKCMQTPVWLTWLKFWKSSGQVGGFTSTAIPFLPLRAIQRSPFSRCSCCSSHIVRFFVCVSFRPLPVYPKSQWSLAGMEAVFRFSNDQRWF